MIIDKLIEASVAKQNPTAVGLDTCIEYVPDFIKERHFVDSADMEKACQAILEFNCGIIDAVYDIVPAVKIQMAYYEMYGLHGIKCFMDTAHYARSKGLIVIGDVKRNDIGSTAEAYASAYLGKTFINESVEQSAFDLDFITVNPYLGFDGIKPFIEACKRYDKGIFILVKTSNPSSGQIQDLITQDGQTIYEIVGQLVEQWGKDMIGQYGYSSIGAVIGATYPEQLHQLRQSMGHTYFLLPGYGAQGGSAKDVVKGFDEHGLGAVINASRSIICAYMSDKWRKAFKPEEFYQAARCEAIDMRNDIAAAMIMNR